MIDIARDPRWGRIAEGLGEDLYLAGILGAAMVRGFQGESIGAPDSIAACAKHYVGYGVAEGGRDYNTTWIPENLLRIKFRMGLFDRGAPAPAGAPSAPTPDALATARQLAAESIVLLKNEGQVLPLAKSIGRVAVIGPFADSPVDQMGTWVLDGRAEDVRTPLAALRQALGEARVVWAPGLKNSRDSARDGFAAVVEILADSC